MHCVLWSHKAPPFFSTLRADRLFTQIIDTYVGVPGLIRTHFGYSEDGKTLIGIYLWQTKADADAFHRCDWITGARWHLGAIAEMHEWHVAQVVESVGGHVVTGTEPFELLDF